MLHEYELESASTIRGLKDGLTPYQYARHVLTWQFPLFRHRCYVKFALSKRDERYYEWTINPNVELLRKLWIEYEVISHANPYLRFLDNRKTEEDIDTLIYCLQRLCKSLTPIRRKVVDRLIRTGLAVENDGLIICDYPPRTPRWHRERAYKREGLSPGNPNKPIRETNAAVVRQGWRYQYEQRKKAREEKERQRLEQATLFENAVERRKAGRVKSIKATKRTYKRARLKDCDVRNKDYTGY